MKTLENNLNKTCNHIPEGYEIKLIEDKNQKGVFIPQLVKKREMKKMIFVYIEGIELPYLLEVDSNLDKYKIKKGNLYEGWKKIGKIAGWGVM